MGSGDIPMTHDALDAEGDIEAADYVRYMLVAAGILQKRDEGLEHAKRWARRLLLTVTGAMNRRTVTEFWSCHVVPNIRFLSETGSARQLGIVRAKRKVRGAVDFMVWLEARGVDLYDLCQADVNEWLKRGSQANDVASFLMWAGTQGYCVRLRVPTAEDLLGLDSEVDKYWRLVDRFLDDEGLDVADRVAGGLVLIYGRRTNEICSLTSDHVTLDGKDVILPLGGRDVQLLPALSALVIRLMRGEGAHGGTVTPDDRRTLFGGPWYREHITPFRLAERLSTHGLGEASDLMTRRKKPFSA
ncbi:hypothetical protein [Phytoactinopolyspora endophytica]|uniref:hypothetical protein n=1 Tax=Phytoactinopolyspora endophytica TaxID=1642495 RepID=UPI001F10D929|nr:hypothetical protein [Phytoactinopolyspora endophytica]